ncbi:ASTRA complex subunit [Ascosphaera pollenicola]|nr:ASTRA complex subunit [Ascosphaera pollenicola]
MHLSFQLQPYLVKEIEIDRAGSANEKKATNTANDNNERGPKRRQGLDTDRTVLLEDMLPPAQSAVSGSGMLPPATPAYVLRGHSCAIHALSFYAGNSRLLSGDAEGWIIAWDIVTRRAAASWKAHTGAILGVEGIEVGGERRIFTHGRDHKFRVWRLNLADEDLMSKVLPADEAGGGQRVHEPWLLHSLDVNALNFCVFSYCYLTPEALRASETESNYGDQPQFYVAVANSISEGGIDIFHLPSQRRVSKVLPEPLAKTGMLMAVDLFVASTRQLYIASGYEDGTSMVHVLKGDLSPSSRLLNAQESWSWEKIYSVRAHSQPVLSLSTSPGAEELWFITSSADAVLAKHPLPTLETDVVMQREVITKPLQVVNTKHAGQQGLKVRSDGKIFATAGWDKRVRVYSCKTMNELAVLKWHREGCFAVAFAELLRDASSITPRPGPSTEADVEGTENSTTLARPTSGGLAAIKERRNVKAMTTHWLAAGGKDFKISLWDIY